MKIDTFVAAVGVIAVVFAIFATRERFQPVMPDDVDCVPISTNEWRCTRQEALHE